MNLCQMATKNHRDRFDTPTVGSLLYVRPPLLKNKYKHNNNNTPTPDLVAEICVGKKL